MCNWKVKLQKNYQTDSCEIIESLVDYILEKKIVMCIKCLHYIDVVFLLLFEKYKLASLEPSG